jgi:aminoglycoside phosphotransferase (APT) family kinase protein
MDPGHVQDYLRRRGFEGARIVAMTPLGQDSQAGLKTYGYGRPLKVAFVHEGRTRYVVLRTMAPDPFGHDRRSDRARVLLDAHDVAAHIPDHVAPLDVGAFDETGRLVQMARGEIFFVTEYVPGRLYARDLSALQDEQEHAPLDRERAEALAGYLARVHARRVDPALYARDIRDTVGGGEGIFGIVDSYPLDHAVAGPERLRAIEHGALELRSELKRRPLRARRTHGDFHPFNILFREGTDFTVLDASRGGAGEPADDVTALSINYLFFELAQRGRFDGPLRGLWDRFWDVYLRRSKDRGVLEAAPLFFAWRGLVVASPVWYPDVDDAVRDRLLAFVERLVEGRAFDPFRVEDLLA